MSIHIHSLTTHIVFGVSEGVGMLIVAGVIVTFLALGLAALATRSGRTDDEGDLDEEARRPPGET